MVRSHPTNGVPEGRRKRGSLIGNDAKCYSCHVSRKREFLDKHRKGKDRMTFIGMVNIPQEAYVAVLGSGEA
ncbi:MAG: hypothetical protein ACF8R9_09610 [Phycisphaerales bacterium JB054]